MKKALTTILCSMLLFSCASTRLESGDKKTQETGKEKAGWTYYSEGLYYKNLGMNAVDPAEKKEYLDKAIELLEKAKDSDEESGRVYYHLAEIYYYRGESKKSLDYAELSIEKENNYYAPYERLYQIRMDRKQYADAAAVLERYLKVDPDNLNTLYTLGLHYYKYMNDNKRSLDKFQRIISLSRTMDMSPEYAENSYYICGYIYFTMNDFHKSFYCYKKVYEINQNNMNAVSMMAITAMSEYNLKEAEKNALLYLESSPNDLNMHYILGLVYYLNNDSKAVEYLSRVIRSKTFEGFYASGLFYELRGETDRAENILKAAIKMREDLVPAYVAMSRISLKKGNMEKAYKDLIMAGTVAFRKGLFDVADRLFYKALEIRKETDYDVYYFLARCQEEKKNYSMAISYYNKYYSSSKENEILIHIGYLYGMQNKYGRAYDYLDKAITMDAENPMPYFFKGVVQIWDKKYKEAALTLEKAIQKKNDEESYYFYYAVCMEKLEKYDRAIEALKSGIKCNPASSRSMNYLAYLYADRNINLEEAYALVIRALDFEPDNAAYLDTLGWIYYRQGNYEKALEFLLQAADNASGEETIDPVIYDHLGDVYMKLGRKESAVMYWEKAFNMNSDKAIEEKIRKAKDGSVRN